MPRGLGPCAIDLAETRPSDLERPEGLPMPLLSNGGVTVSVSRRREPMPFCWRNVDGDELFFLHRGARRSGGDGPRPGPDGRSLNLNI